MTRIHDPLTLRNNTIKNRIVMAPMVTFSFHGDNGSYYGKQHVEHYAAHAKGGAGLIIVQATSVFGASDSTNQWSMDNREILTQISGNCHDHGAAVMMQLSCGDMDINGLSLSDIQSMQQDMQQAAISAYEMGFDGVEFHFAHGFTLCKMLDRAYNQRTDHYGGTLENRARVLTEILPEIRRQTHSKFIIGVRMGEYLPDSADGIEAAHIFEQSGIDVLHVSFGMQPPTHEVPEGFICGPMAYSGQKIRRSVQIPVITVGDLRTEKQVRYLIENDCVNFAGIGRGMLADPEFANHVLNGEPVNACLGCSRCLWFTDHTQCPARKKR